ncbi:thioredoxin family protein [Flavobacterium sp. ZT3R18]|uniref:thioredoxin family protein n=1 Tax=Flavobacterium sp. ZT3R18 TaxID=2594429 RepID=UPI00117AD0E4|nr:thioredoxin family protein [Flavobacterium sp. ZT3R18]TRX35294.1 thioredoxin family protein [Flavobacterium sp. ZT3R18]
MKKVFLITLFLIGGLAIQAQELKWYTNVKEAIKVSNKKKKPLMLFFTGSDWCGWCIRLQNEVLKTPEFNKWAQESVILVELDFPRRTAQSDEIKKQNDELQQAFGVQGFPTVYFANATVNKEGKVNFEGLGSTGYVAGGPTAWLAVADPFVKNSALKGKSKKSKKD